VAGVPIDAYEEILDYEEILPETAADGEYFGLRVSGDSMEPKFSEGDVVIVRQQSDADSGDIVIALVNGSDATIKRLIKYAEGGIALVASNPTYAPLRFTEAEISSKPVQIVGKVVELRAKF
jgi:repressor LexA